MPSSAALAADYDKNAEYARNISKAVKTPIGVAAKPAKDSAKKCELSESLKPLSISPRDTSSVSKNATVISEDKKAIKLNM